jgi:hypothetical protein
MKHALVIAAVSALSAGSVALFVRVAPPLAPSPAASTAHAAADAHPREVAGLWTRWPSSSKDGDPLRCYFFHVKGIGLYRFGKIGLNTTQSFDWRVDNGEIVMTFRKTGNVTRTPYTLAGPGQGKPRSLTLRKDPKEPLAGSMEYTYVPAPDLAAADLFPTGPASIGEGIGGRMWIDVAKFATGGSAFSMYQLKDTAIDGRGVGWHHVGDFDDWSTEALAFRFSPSSCKQDAQLDLAFSVRGDRASTRVMRKDAQLVLVEDPRSFWHLRTYRDGGKSFSLMPR